MNIPFPNIYPRLADPKWFNPDSPADEDAELTAMEVAHQNKMNAIANQYSKYQPFGKRDHERMEEEAETDEEANEESEETEESHDDDDEVVIQAARTPPQNNNPLDPNIVEVVDLEEEEESVELTTSD